MKPSLPIRIVHQASQKLRYPALTLASILSLLVAAILLTSNTVFGELEPQIFVSTLERLGFNAILTLMPAYMLACLIVAVNSANANIAVLSQLCESKAVSDLVATKYSLGRYWSVMILLGGGTCKSKYRLGLYHIRLAFAAVCRVYGIVNWEFFLMDYGFHRLIFSFPRRNFFS